MGFGLVSSAPHCFLQLTSAWWIIVLVPGCCWSFPAFSACHQHGRLSRCLQWQPQQKDVRTEEQKSIVHLLGTDAIKGRSQQDAPRLKEATAAPPPAGGAAASTTKESPVLPKPVASIINLIFQVDHTYIHSRDE